MTRARPARSAVDPRRLAFGDQVRRARDQLSYRAAAKQAGVSATVLRRVEQGKTVGTAALAHVIRWLGLWPRTRLWAPRGRRRRSRETA